MGSGRRTALRRSSVRGACLLEHVGAIYRNSDIILAQVKSILVLFSMTMLAADQQGWSPREGVLLKYRVNLRFGEELVSPPPAPNQKADLRFDGDDDTMPPGWKFGRVSAVAVNAQGEVFVFHRGHRADPMIIFDAKGRYLRSWGKGMFTSPHGLRIDPAGNVWTTDVGSHQVMKFTQKGELLLTLGKKGQTGATRDTFNKPTDVAFARDGGLCPMATATRA